MSTRSYDAALAFGARGEGLGALGAALLAGALHLGLALASLFVPNAATRTPERSGPLDVELVEWRAPPVPAPLVPAEAAPPAPAAPPPVPPRHLVPARPAPASPQPPPAAHAGALLTASAEAPPSAPAPVRFVTDPSGASYGYGVVANGGTAERGLAGATAAHVETPEGGGVRESAGPGDGITPASQLSRPPRLDEPDACRGHFPASSASDHGVVVLLVVVRPNGSVGRVRVERESPVGEGFGRGARECVRARSFTPALDAAGLPTTAAARVTLRFTR